jgi:uncharacterized membrane protein (UPF0127 family)
MDRLSGMPVLRLAPPDGGELSIFLARRFGQRLLGLAGLARMPLGTGLLIPDARSIHTFGMRFRLDILFVAAGSWSLDVIEVHRSVAPRRVVRARRRGLDALELPAGEARRLGLMPGLGLCHPPPCRLEPERSSQAFGQVPVPVPEELHRGGHEHRSHNRRVEQDRRR